MVNETQKRSSRRNGGQFDGYRVNCEVVPCLPARIVTECLSDPRRIPYLLFWKHRYSGVLMEVVRIAPPSPESGWFNMDGIEVKRGDGSKVSIQLCQGARGFLLVCNSCQIPRRSLYGWETNDGPRNVSRAPWPCRVCAGLSYASEGGALFIRRLLPELKPFWRLLRKPRPDLWEPLVFTSLKAAVDAGLASRSLDMPVKNAYPRILSEGTDLAATGESEGN